MNKDYEQTKIPMEIKNFIFYSIFSGIVYASFLYDSKRTKVDNILNCIFGILNGFCVFPMLIGRALNKLIYSTNTKQDKAI